MNDNEYDIDPKPITPDEVASYAHRWRVITNCPQGKSFTQHLTELIEQTRQLREALQATVDKYNSGISSHPAEFVSLADAKELESAVAEAERVLGGRKS